MTILMINIRCLRVNLLELELHLQTMRPHIVFLQETWLDASTETVSICGYAIVSRRDRSDHENRGGILSLVRDDFNKLVHVENSITEERSWHFLHIEAEILLVGNWYRPRAKAQDSFVDL
mgnify:FL=1